MKIKILIIAILTAVISFAGIFGFQSSFLNTKLSDPKGISYDEIWRKADSLLAKGLPKSALEYVESAYIRAKTEGNSTQLVKSIIYKTRMISEFEENHFINSIINIEKEIKEAPPITRQILHSVTADFYLAYFQNYRWLIMGRSQTSGFVQNDINTWDVSLIKGKIKEHYLLSLKDKESLQETPLKLYDAILQTEELSKKYRPTLFDFLAHRALSFFSSPDNFSIKTIEDFEMENPEFFSIVYKYAELDISPVDTSSSNYIALKIFQEILNYHLIRENLSAIIDADLKRLQFVRNASVMEEKDSLYLNALKELEKLYAPYPASAEIAFEIAKLYLEQGNNYVSGKDTQAKWAKKKAVEKCKNTIESFPKTDGASNCKVLLQNILSKSMNIQNAQAEIPDKPFLVKIDYKNVTTAYFRVIKLDYDQNKKLVSKKYGTDLVKEYLKSKPVFEWKVEFPIDEDYNNHSLEIKCPSLPNGFYILIAGTSPDFSMLNEIVSFGSLWITEMSYIKRELNSLIEVHVLDRHSGEPLKNVKVNLYYQEYNQADRIYNFILSKSFITDQNGYIGIPSGNSPKSAYLEFSRKNDRFASSPVYLYPRTKNVEKAELQTWFFTDRAIYRPGQTIYFKGLLLERLKGKSEIKTKFPLTVSLFDPNSQVVSTIEVVSNEFGSVSGSFTAPSSGLTGNLTISCEYGSTNISLEEYKRPKFEVIFDPLKGSQKLQENVSVSGKAVAYAGNQIDDARVSYRVTRTVRYPYMDYWRRPPFPLPETEIANGITKTNENGEFKVIFLAKPDRSVLRENNPVFNFKIYADVTDINGETSSSETLVKLGYQSLYAKIVLPEFINKNTENEILIKTTNSAGEAIPAEGIITICKLTPPERILRKRLWEKPDKYRMTREEFYKSFPNDIYSDENLKENWQKSKAIYSIPFNTENSEKLDLSNYLKSMEGNYIMELKTKDKDGKTVETKSYFYVFEPKSDKLKNNVTDLFIPLSSSAEPGEKVSILIGSGEDFLKVLFEVIRGDRVLHKEWIYLKNEQKIVDFLISEEHRGNISFQITYVKNNRIYTKQSNVEVPYSNKKLSIEFETFRNKLQPGQEEEWKIKITGPGNQKQVAEFLASMYDASLDKFRKNPWNFNIYPMFENYLNWDATYVFGVYNGQNYSLSDRISSNFRFKKYDRLITIFSSYINFGDGNYYMDEMASFSTTAISGQKGKNAKAIQLRGAKALSETSDNLLIIEDKAEVDNVLHEETETIPIRSNFNETAFFYPNLLTNENGDIIISFKIPESLTKWKFQGFGHTKDLKFGFIEKEITVSKKLMVVPSPPRFFREHDQIIFTAKISNISEEDLSGQATLFLYDAFDMQPIDKIAGNIKPTVLFSSGKGTSNVVSWSLKIPEGIGAITYRIIAKAGNFGDGEERVIPVITNRMLVTETMPMNVRAGQTKTFSFDKLIQSGSSTTLKNYKLTLEYTSNPAWYAIQALPYLMEYPYECSEQIFSRYYANSIASYVANSNPKIKNVFESWRNLSPDAFLSNLEKNQELKNLIIEETPWLRQAKDESQRKQQIALLFDLNRMSLDSENALSKLLKAQMSNGGWPWFKGGPDSKYITQHIVAGFGHLEKLGVLNIKANSKLKNSIEKAVKYMDNRIIEDYEELKKYLKTDMNNYVPGEIQTHYLYARSFFSKWIEINSSVLVAFDFYVSQAKKNWLKTNIYSQAMIGLALHRFDDKSTPLNIIKSLKEKALQSEEMGIYWRKDNGYFWYEAPIETQALLIEFFDEVANDQKSVEEMKIWLLKQKQTQDWKTTKATVEACYALLLRGTDIISNSKLAEITVGDQKIEAVKMSEKNVEAGTGYFKTTWSGNDIKPIMGKVLVTGTSSSVSWGSMYWQYFEQLDKITTASTPLALKKQLFVERNTAKGPQLFPVKEKEILHVGDKIKVRIELRCDRDMEYIHMKDMRASCFEPVNVISGYKWQSGLGYYESTRDAATNFFINYLPKGTFVFEYPMFVTHKGNFSNGITTIQCMYAPEFSSHSEGIRVRVE